MVLFPLHFGVHSWKDRSSIARNGKFRLAFIPSRGVNVHSPVRGKKEREGKRERKGNGWKKGLLAVNAVAGRGKKRKGRRKGGRRGFHSSCRSISNSSPVWVFAWLNLFPSSYPSFPIPFPSTPPCFTFLPKPVDFSTTLEPCTPRAFSKRTQQDIFL